MLGRDSELTGPSEFRPECPQPKVTTMVDIRSILFPNYQSPALPAGPSTDGTLRILATGRGTTPFPSIRLRSQTDADSSGTEFRIGTETEFADEAFIQGVPLN